MKNTYLTNEIVSEFLTKIGQRTNDLRQKDILTWDEYDFSNFYNALKNYSCVLTYNN